MLINFLETISENYNVRIVGTDERLLSEYDGRNSIDEKYNNSEVLRIDIVNENTFEIMIYE